MRKETKLKRQEKKFFCVLKLKLKKQLQTYLFSLLIETVDVCRCSDKVHQQFTFVSVLVRRQVCPRTSWKKI